MTEVYRYCHQSFQAFVGVVVVRDRCIFTRLFQLMLNGMCSQRLFFSSPFLPFISCNFSLHALCLSFFLSILLPFLWLYIFSVTPFRIYLNRWHIPSSFYIRFVHLFQRIINRRSSGRKLVWHYQLKKVLYHEVIVELSTAQDRVPWG
jgi:hypothetical protein